MKKILFLLLSIATAEAQVTLKATISNTTFNGIATVMRLGTNQFIDSSEISKGRFQVKLPVGEFKIYMSSDNDNNYVIVKILPGMGKIVSMDFKLEQRHNNIL